MAETVAKKALKNEKGARLRTPSLDSVDTNAMGLGTTEPMSTRYIA